MYGLNSNQLKSISGGKKLSLAGVDCLFAAACIGCTALSYVMSDFTRNEGNDTLALVFTGLKWTGFILTLVFTARAWSATSNDHRENN